MTEKCQQNDRKDSGRTKQMTEKWQVGFRKDKKLTEKWQVGFEHDKKNDKAKMTETDQVLRDGSTCSAWGSVCWLRFLLHLKSSIKGIIERKRNWKSKRGREERERERDMERKRKRMLLLSFPFSWHQDHLRKGLLSFQTQATNLRIGASHAPVSWKCVEKLFFNKG